MSASSKADSGSRKQEDQPGSASARQPSGGSRRRRQRVPFSDPVSRIFLSEHASPFKHAEDWLCCWVYIVGSIFYVSGTIARR